MFYFTAQRTDTGAPYKICLLGDLGLVNGVSLGRLQRETQRGAYDLVIDLGEYCLVAYCCCSAEKLGWIETTTHLRTESGRHTVKTG
jgi:hypothetical protein